MVAKDDSMDAVLKTFREFDADGNGTIARSELARVLRTLDQKYWTKARIDTLMSTVDRNNDGCISFDEFVRWIWADSGESNIFGEGVQDAVRQSLEASFRGAYQAAKSGNFKQCLRIVSINPSAILGMHHAGNGNTLLHEVVRVGNLDHVKEILSMNANPLLTNNLGLTAAQVAEKGSEMNEVLEAAIQAEKEKQGLSMSWTRQLGESMQKLSQVDTDYDAAMKEASSLAGKIPPILKELKRYPNPPEQIRLVWSALVHIVGFPEKMDILDWDTAHRHVHEDKEFAETVDELKMGHINPPMILRVKTLYTKAPKWNYEQINHKSHAAGLVCKWIEDVIRIAEDCDLHNLWMRQIDTIKAKKEAERISKEEADPSAKEE